MAEIYITLLQPTDKLIVALFKKIDEMLESVSRATVSIASGSYDLADGSIDSIIKKNQSLIESIATSSLDINISYNSLKIKNKDTYLNSHPYYCTIKLKKGYDGHSQNPNPTHDSNTIISVHTTINSFLIKHKLLPINVATSINDELSAQAALLSAIQTSAADQIARSDEFFHGLIDRFDNRNSELESKYQERVNLLEEQFKEKEALFGKGEEELEARRKELDDRDHMHARRAIRGELIKTVQERQKSFEVDPTTRRLRWPIHLIFGLLLFATGVGAAWSLYVWGASLNDSWGPITLTSALKTTIFTLGFLTTAGLYETF